MVFRLTNVRKSNKELGLNVHQFLCLMHRVNKLWLIQFFTRHRHNTIHLRHHMHGRRLVETTTYLHQVVHIVAEQSRIRRHIRTIAFALLQLIDLQEMLVWLIQFALFHKLIVVEMGEQHRLVRIIQREAESTFRSDIAQLLVHGFIPIELVHILLHINLRITAFPGRK